MCVRTRCDSWNVARFRSLRRLDKISADAPTRKMQLVMRYARSLPWYQFSVMHSVLTTNTRVLGRVLSRRPNHNARI